MERLFAALDEMKLADNTIIFFSSDNGPEDYRIGYAGVGTAGPLRARKRSMDEGGIRTFGLVRWPGHTSAGRRDESSVTNGVDFLPTVCKLADVNVPDNLKPDGGDVSDIWLGKITSVTPPCARPLKRLGRPRMAMKFPSTQRPSTQQTRPILTQSREMKSTLTDLTAILPGSLHAAGESAQKPKILWLIAEDMSPHFGCHGEKSIQTPDVDMLAARGVLFERAFVTVPICSPSRSALLTGMYQTGIGAHHRQAGGRNRRAFAQ